MNIFENIVNYFKRFFSKQKTLPSGEIEQDALPRKENTFINSLQKESKDYINKQSILDAIDKNPELIDTLSYERLVQLNIIYEEKINELKRKISELS